MLLYTYSAVKTRKKARYKFTGGPAKNGMRRKGFQSHMQMFKY